jgi:hypothetical protein
MATFAFFSNRLVLLLGVIVLFGCGVGIYFLVFVSDSPNPNPKTMDSVPDPRLAYDGPFRNIHPDIKEVGNQLCFTCHSDICQKYQHHSMGKSLRPIAKLVHQQQYTPEVRNPFIEQGLEHSIEVLGDHVWHKEVRRDDKGKVLYERKVEVKYAMGSGNNGHSYMTLRDGGYLFQTWISWFSQKKIWDISPGFRTTEWNYLGRPVIANCLFCHANRVDPVPGTANQYKEPIFRGHSIGCERCHGPGELHVRERETLPDALGIDYTIVNPKHLEPSLREAVCQQCHLEGESRVVRRGRQASEFRPGLKLEDFITVFVEDHQGQDRKAVNHVEQMYLSKCFTGSKAKLGCSTCHNPHEHLEEDKKESYHRANCMKCHEDCSLPKSKRIQEQADDSCIACHMPRFSSQDIAHTASTNHQILRHRPKKSENSPFGAPILAQHEFFIFPDHRIDISDREILRDYALGLSDMVGKNHIPAVRAIKVVKQASEAFPDQPDVWLAYGNILDKQGGYRQSLAAFEKVIELDPDRELAWIGAASCALRLEEQEKAIRYLQRAVEINPWLSQIQSNLSLLLIERGRWEEAKPHLDRWLEIDPGNNEGRFTKVRWLYHQGKKGEAEKEFQFLESLLPKKMLDYKRRYSELKQRS